MGEDILQDLLRPGLRLVICGTAASTTSASAGAYYAGRGNKFWPTLHAVGLTPRRLAPSEWRMADLYGIGFTDLAKRHFGMDRDLPADSFDSAHVARAIEQHRPRVLAFNGKTAGRAYLGRVVPRYGLQEETTCGTAIWVLPSTSGAASGAWTIAPWRDLADALAERDR